MLFRAAAIFTTLACAVSSFAAPLGPDTSAVTGVLSSLTGSVPAVGARQLPPLTGLFGNSNPAGIVDGIAPRAQASAAAALVTRGDDHPTIPDAFQGACDQLVEITVKLRACLDVAVDVDVVVGLLGQIVVVLKGLLVNLTFILNNPVGFVLTLQGKIITVQQLGVIVYTLLATVITVLALVVRVVNITVHGVVGTLVAEIGLLLAQIVVVVLSLVAGLLVHITVLLGPIIADIRVLGFAKLIACLHI